MATSVQTPILVAQACPLSSSQTAVSPNQNTPSTPSSPLVPSQLSGNDIVSIIIAISVLVEVILDNPTKPKR